MPKNKGKGGKNRRRGKNENEGLKRELVNFKFNFFLYQWCASYSDSRLGFIS